MDINKMLSDSIVGLSFVYSSQNPKDKLCTVASSDCCHSFVDGDNRWVHLIITFNIISHYQKPCHIGGAIRRTLRPSFIDNVNGDERIWDYVKVIQLGSQTVSHGNDAPLSGTLNFLVKYKHRS